MSKFSHIKVLILDKNRDFHGIISNAIAGIEVTNFKICASVDEAHGFLQDDWIPDLIIMEINLGGKAGLNFLVQLRSGQMAVNKNLPIIIMTQNLEPNTAFRACEIGFEHFIKKPFEEEALQKRVVSVLQNPRRFVISKGFFGPNRRDTNALTNYNNEERRGVKTKPVVPPTSNVKMPDHFPTSASAGDRLVKDAAEGAYKAAKIDLSRALDTETNSAVAASLEAKEQLKSAPKPQPIKQLKPTAALPKVTALEPQEKKEKEKIEIAAPSKKTEDDGNPDRAANIAAKLEAHSNWLASHGSEGEKANFSNEDLSGADLSEANLASANLRNADLQDANLNKANLFDADLRSANMSGANFGEADLHNAKLRHANLKAALLPEVGLRGADLAGANLQGAQLVGADFKDANFLGTNICEADLLGVNLTQKQIDKANGDASTNLPPGIRIKVD